MRRRSDLAKSVLFIGLLFILVSIVVQTLQLTYRMFAFLLQWSLWLGLALIAVAALVYLFGGVRRRASS